MGMELYTKLWVLLHIVKIRDNKPGLFFASLVIPPLSGKLTSRKFSGYQLNVYEFISALINFSIIILLFHPFTFFSADIVLTLVLNPLVNTISQGRYLDVNLFSMVL